jgi:hypothetical protein
VDGELFKENVALERRGFWAIKIKTRLPIELVAHLRGWAHRIAVRPDEDIIQGKLALVLEQNIKVGINLLRVGPGEYVCPS